MSQLYRAVTTYAAFLAEAPALVVGDWNSNQRWDAERPGRNHTAVLAQLATHGLSSAYHAWAGEAQGAETTPTFHMYRGRAQAFHIDYCCMPQAWLPQLQDVHVGDYDPWCQLSDHRPLWVTVAGTWRDAT
ncbi:MAG TPA: hypothetical protein VGE07_14180 [Herpetosiphonaceae bacterium]